VPERPKGFEGIEELGEENSLETLDIDENALQAFIESHEG